MPESTTTIACYEFTLPSGETVKVDESDRALAQSIRWWRLAGAHTNTTYVQGKRNGRTVLLHRLLMGVLHAGHTVHVDHINGDGLDNRRDNLRVCTSRQNLGNARIRVDNASGHRGVTWNRSSGKWQTGIGFRSAAGRQFCYLGSYTDVDAAARAYDRVACAIRGEFAHGQDGALNYPQEHTVGCCADSPDPLVRKALRIQAEVHGTVAG